MFLFDLVLNNYLFTTTDFTHLFIPIEEKNDFFKFQSLLASSNIFTCPA